MLSDMGGRDGLENRLQQYIGQVLQYHDPAKQEFARALLPMEELQEKAAIALAKEGKFDPTKEELDHFFLLELLVWFRGTFRWVNSPPCDFCTSPTHHIGMGGPTSEELQFGANRVEIYSCELCGDCTRFPRYNDPAKLMETQCGRCGEWANCFTFYCVALGYESRLVIDFTDHVWTECYSAYLGRWMHLDPCEASYDKPLLYEKGWGKKLSYTIAVSRDGVYDVTRRYTRRWQEVLSRRNITAEGELEEMLAILTAVQRSTLPPEEFDILEARDKQEDIELSGAELDQGTDSENLPGRVSGSKEWRIARGEIGQQIKSERRFCSPRLCTDEHVGKIYEAIGLLLSEDGLQSAANRLEKLQQILVQLKKEPFKTRRLMLRGERDQVVHGKSAISFLHALGLDFITENGELYLGLKDSPGKVALSLLVATENLELVTRHCSLKDSPFWFMMAGRRVCGGTAYATGEEAPSGTVAAAFDGLYSTKWEEPDGAKGAWLVYHLQPGGFHRIIGYDLTSANDCPERDPMDWVLEGSSDGGETWHSLDERSAQLFEERFERRCFRVEPAAACNVLRIRFSAARDIASNSRLQISCINFYTEKSSLLLVDLFQAVLYFRALEVLRLELEDSESLIFRACLVGILMLVTSTKLEQNSKSKS